jgi:1,4-dihydroxy-2-naphthoyl-CoA hydrolase
VSDTPPSHEGTLPEVLGFEAIEVGPEVARARFEVKQCHRQPYGIVHGGVYCTLVETAASVAAAIWFGERGHVVGVNNSTNFIRATREGTLTATATPLQRGRTQQLWQVAVVDDDDRLVAHGQVRLANITNAEQIGGTSGAALPKP